ncbi:lipopolysaccharide biosynthesis protein [Pigmentiphaga litoralis]|uniref:O-antigen/teichoic acid export membrane protein n=1 Tax=Pigmentiphaga litoralis TaxID=516702 RepID=A0A7Y9IYM5_9BURK|nr:capsular biosynthesis protein [Pigmentiphaga litoralis]NYE26400.1 O-antigen/teichoic acid export membrane protein [Pigmentiphaga litoralis]NYE85520.1 O-antigen/teichoic acid export membrane protein [Pigmentiphaga litoralis]
MAHGDTRPQPGHPADGSAGGSGSGSATVAGRLRSSRLGRKLDHKLVKLFGSSIIDQAMLSAANFVVGLILIRYTPEAQYGYYVLAFNAMMLATTLQGTFVGTPLVIHLPQLSNDERRSWIGSLLRDQIRWGAIGSVVTIAFAAVAWSMGWLDREAGPVLLAGLALIACALYREYFRAVLMMYQRTVPVLGADAVYVVCLIAGGALATRFPAAAVTALLTAAASALIGAALLRRVLRPEFDPHAAPGRLAGIAKMGAMAAAGGVIYWLFTQGYSFLAAATLNVTDVAALAASRLLLMPINLLSSGVQRQLVPIASNWVHEHGVASTLRKLILFSAGIGALTLVYGIVVWVLRDWIFLDLMRKRFEDRDTLLLMWIAIFLVMVVRDPLNQLLVLRQRFRILMAVSLVCAVISLSISYVGMVQLGTRGALIGILTGELLNLVAVLWLARVESRTDTHGKAADGKAVHGKAPVSAAPR